MRKNKLWYGISKSRKRGFQPLKIAPELLPKAIFLLIWIMAFVFAFTNTPLGLGSGMAYAQETGKEMPTIAERRADTAPAFAKGRIIVKFKSEGDDGLKLCAEGVIARKMSFTEAVSSGGEFLDILVKRYGIKNAKPLFRQSTIDTRERTIAKSGGKRQPGLISLQALRNQNQSEIEQIKKRFPQRSARAPEDTRIPDLFHIYVLELDENADVLRVVEDFSSLPQVEYAHPEYIMPADSIPEDSSTDDVAEDGYIWGLEKINAESAWRISQGEGVVVAVIDSGVDYNHPDIRDNIWLNPEVLKKLMQDKRTDGKIKERIKEDTITLSDFDINGDGNIDPDEIIDDLIGWNFPGEDNNPMDFSGHGTHIAGTIAAIGNNEFGVIGVAPKAKIMPVVNSSFRTHLGIYYAVKNGTDVINCSWPPVGIEFIDPTVKCAVQFAHSLGVVAVFSGGNASQYLDYGVSRMRKDAIIVGASAPDDKTADFSCYGTAVDVVAPGVNILSLSAQKGKNPIAEENPDAALDNDYVFTSGTSMATPHVAGLAALLLSDNPSLKPEEIRRIIRVSADDIGILGFDIYSGYGRINASRALEWAHDVESFPQAKIITPNSFTDINPKDVFLNIRGIAKGPNFEKYQLYYMEDGGSEEWIPIGEPAYESVDSEQEILGKWDISEFEGKNVKLLLRLAVTSTNTATSTNEPVEIQDVVRIFIFPPEPYNSRPILYGDTQYESPVISGDWIVYVEDRH